MRFKLALIIIGVLGCLSLLFLGQRTEAYIRKDTGAIISVHRLGFALGPGLELSREEVATQASRLITTMIPSLQNVSVNLANCQGFSGSFHGLLFYVEGDPSSYFQISNPLPLGDEAIAMEFLIFHANHDPHFIPELQNFLAHPEQSFQGFKDFQIKLRHDFAVWLIANYPEVAQKYNRTIETHTKK